jgi:hypothetical protein
MFRGRLLKVRPMSLLPMLSLLTTQSESIQVTPKRTNVPGLGSAARGTRGRGRGRGGYRGGRGDYNAGYSPYSRGPSRYAIHFFSHPLDTRLIMCALSVDEAAIEEEEVHRNISDDVEFIYLSCTILAFIIDIFALSNSSISVSLA